MELLRGIAEAESRENDELAAQRRDLDRKRNLVEKQIAQKKLKDERLMKKVPQFCATVHCILCSCLLCRQRRIYRLSNWCKSRRSKLQARLARNQRRQAKLRFFKSCAATISMVIISTAAGFGGAGSLGFRAATPDGTSGETCPFGMLIASIPVTQREIGNNGGLGVGKVRAQLCCRPCRGLSIEQMQSAVRGCAAVGGAQRWFKSQLATATLWGLRIDVRLGAAIS